MLNPRILLLDEPLEGLAPIIVEELLAALRRILREEGMSAILVEQNARKILRVADRAVIIERGVVVCRAKALRCAPIARCWKPISASPTPERGAPPRLNELADRTRRT